MPPNASQPSIDTLIQALLPAENNIVKFKPPSAGQDPPIEPPDPNFTVSIETIQEEIAQKSAEERARILYPFFDQMIRVIFGEMLAREQILQRLSNLEQRISGSV
jgi:hypothetical protein